MSLLSGYLLVAYFAGKSLTRSQVMIINTLTVWFSAILIFSMYTSLHSLVEFHQTEAPEYAEGAASRSSIFKWVLVTGCAIASLACFKFMWEMCNSANND
jgi:hypothetical protein